MTTIKKIVLHNFKRFTEFEVNVDPSTNIFIGDNEAGKSSVLTAIDLVLSGSKSKVETLGMSSIFNTTAISDFFAGAKEVARLPKLYVEIYLTEQGNFDLNGKYNSKGVTCDGLSLECELNPEYGPEVALILNEEGENFPFEYYSIKFTTFSGESYTGYRRFLKHLMVDSSQINSDYATREYTRAVYSSHASMIERHKHENEYRKHKTAFKNAALNDMNSKLAEYKFSVRTSPKASLESDLIITEDDIPIESKGKGKQCIIKTEFALQKGKQALDVVLLEEPENHLSHVNMRKLIDHITNSDKNQLFIATHSNLICTRLDLRKAITLNAGISNPVVLKDLPSDTAKFFIKAPDNNILEFALSKRVILVEGDAEFILLESLYGKYSGSTLAKDAVHVISVGGTSFKRYLDLAKLLKVRTAVVRDNDKDYANNCVANYAGYVETYIKVFADTDNARETFERCFYQDNTSICDELFLPGRVSLSVQDYMLKNKADCAFELLDKKGADLKAPDYIQQAIAWIRE